MFINTLPLFFSAMAYASPLELLIILLGIYVVLFMTAPSDETLMTERPFDNYLFAAWIGKTPLLWVFWPFFLIFNASLAIADYFAKMGMLTVSSWDDVHVALALPLVWWMTGIWRCSANCEGRAWSAAARLMTVGVVFECALRLMIRIDLPRLFFNCEELLMDYGSCF
jgi:hypothetical protein